MAFGPYDRDETEGIADVPPWPSGNDPISQDSQTDSNDNGQEEFLFHLYRGSELLKDNQMLEAKEELEQALTLQPRDVKGQDLLAVVYFRLGLYPRAIHLYEQLRRLNPKDPSLKLNLALCYLKTGQTPLAKSELEQLVVAHPNHTRAWGYLGLAYERLSDYIKAEHAYNVAGHEQRARKMAEKLGRPPLPTEEERDIPSREVREVVAQAAEGLDHGLSFALAAPASEGTLASGNQQWKSVELGQAEKRRQSSRAPALPIVGPGPDLNAPRRPTLVVAPPPAHMGPPEDVMQLPSVGAPSSPLFDDAEPPNEDPVLPESARGFLGHAPPPAPTQQALDADDDSGAHAIPRGHTSNYPPKRFAEPAAQRESPPPPRAAQSKPSAKKSGSPNSAPMSIAAAAERGRIEFPAPGGIVLHSPAIALLRTRSESKKDGKQGLAVRLEAVRSMSGGVTTNLLERHARGRSLGESFGGIGSPVVDVTGDGELVVFARPGGTLQNFALTEESCFLREDVVVAFDRMLEFDNGKLATSEGEYLSVVQFRGTGSLLAEVRGQVITLEVSSGKSIHVRRESIVGWFGRLVPRALSPSEAPSGQRGLVAFAGDGTVLLSL